jgi:hypothetical protein
MKKIIYITFVSLSLVFASCHENDENYGRFDSADTSSGWVQYKSDACVGLLYGLASEIQLPIELHVPVNKEGTEVFYSITDVSGNSTSIIPQRTGSVVITAEDQINEIDVASQTEVRYMLKNLVIPINNDAGLSETTEFDVTITSTNKSQIQVGLSDDSKPTVVRVVIRSFNDATTYTYGGTAVQMLQPGNTPAFVGPDFTQTLIPVVGNPRQFTTASAWGVLFVPTLANNPAAIRDYPATITINDDYTVTVVGINAPTSPNRYQGGEGTYDPCSDTFELTLRQGVFTSPFTVDVTYSPVIAD